MHLPFQIIPYALLRTMAVVVVTVAAVTLMAHKGNACVWNLQLKRNK